jgi:hypothetical protein
MLVLADSFRFHSARGPGYAKLCEIDLAPMKKSQSRGPVGTQRQRCLLLDADNQGKLVTCIIVQSADLKIPTL